MEDVIKIVAASLLLKESIGSSILERSWDHKFVAVYVAATARLLRPIVLPVTIGGDKNVTEMCDV